MAKIGTAAIGYGWTGLTPKKLATDIGKCVNVARKIYATIGFDAVAFAGSSGAALAFPIAMDLRVPIIYVRKENENSHGSEVECNSNTSLKRYLIVDDFITSGDTVRRIIDQITKISTDRNASPLTCMGILLYANDGRNSMQVNGNNLRCFGKTSLSKIKLT